MGRVQQSFTNGAPGAVSRSIDDVIISVRNVSAEDIAFGAPVFLSNDGAEPFSTADPQDFSSFLGFAVRAAAKTPDEYPAGQNADPFSQQGVWKAGDLMEVLVRGSVVIRMTTAAHMGDKVYLRKSDGKLTPTAGTTGTTFELQNVRIRNQRDANLGTTEVVVTERNVL